jgi:hypothetical protein
MNFDIRILYLQRILTTVVVCLFVLRMNLVRCADVIHCNPQGLNYFSPIKSTCVSASTFPSPQVHSCHCSGQWHPPTDQQEPQGLKYHMSCKLERLRVRRDTALYSRTLRGRILIVSGRVVAMYSIFRIVGVSLLSSRFLSACHPSSLRLSHPLYKVRSNGVEPSWCLRHDVVPTKNQHEI